MTVGRTRLAMTVYHNLNRQSCFWILVCSYAGYHHLVATVTDHLTALAWTCGGMHVYRAGQMPDFFAALDTRGTSTHYRSVDGGIHALEWSHIQL